MLVQKGQRGWGFTARQPQLFAYRKVKRGRGCKNVNKLGASLSLFFFDFDRRVSHFVLKCKIDKNHCESAASCETEFECSFEYGNWVS